MFVLFVWLCLHLSIHLFPPTVHLTLEHFGDQQSPIIVDTANWELSNEFHYVFIILTCVLYFWSSTMNCAHWCRQQCNSTWRTACLMASVTLGFINRLNHPPPPMTCWCTVIALTWLVVDHLHTIYVPSTTGLSKV